MLIAQRSVLITWQCDLRAIYWINFSPAKMKTTRSNKLFDRAKSVIPGGVNSPVRAFKSVGMNPVFITKAKGAYIWDVDGNRYVDYVGSWGPMILGHAHPDRKSVV